MPRMKKKPAHHSHQHHPLGRSQGESHVVDPEELLNASMMRKGKVKSKKHSKSGKSE